MDLVDAIAAPLPREPMTRLLGLPLEDQDRLQHGSDHSIRLMSGLLSQPEIAESLEISRGWCSTSSSAREHRELVPDFVEEVVRVDPVAIGNYRRTMRDTELAGVKLPKGSTLHPLWGSANRDEARFPEPDRFRMGRPEIKGHLGFGHAKRFCLGASLARMETRVTVGALLERFEKLDLVDRGQALRYKPGLVVRRPERLRAVPG